MHKPDFFEAKILVVDDEPQKVRLVSELLGLGGYRSIQSQTDSARATATFESFRPDLVILDLHMAPLDGIEVLNQLKPRIDKAEYLPILMLTGDITREAKERALNAGAMDFLAKPFNATEILLRVRNLLQTRWLYLELQEQKGLLEARVQERTAELEEARDEVIERLAIVAEFRDDNTGQHTHRVSDMVRKIAVAMGLPEPEAELTARASLLHDIGKVGIRDALLLKPGRYTDEEREEMKKHSTIGGEILHGSKSDVLQRAEEIARCHHEWWNGTGHHGLVGDAIPIGARITAVADVYDALTSERPYKEAWKQEAALAEIERLSGNHFDPDVVTAFLRVVRVPVGARRG